MKNLLTLAAILFLYSAAAQTGIGTVSPSPSAALDVTSSTKGFLPPRMTWTQIQAIANPTAGLQVYDIGNKVMRVYDGTQWTAMGPRTGQGLHDAPGAYSNVPYGIAAGGSITYNALAIGPDKSIIIGGSYYGNANLAGLSFSIGGSNAQAFFAKLDSNGNGLFVKTLTCSNISVVTSITTDANGLIYVAGYYTGQVDLDPSSNLAAVTSLGAEDVFIARYSSLGGYLWGKTFGGSGTDVLNAIATDGSNIYACGSYTGSSNFGSSLTSAGGTDGWVGSYWASTGAPSWSKSMGGAGADAAYSVCLTSTGGGATVCGNFSGSATFGSTTLSNSTQAGFLTFISVSGAFNNAYKIGGTGITNALDLQDEGGNTYVSGQYSGTVNFSLTGTANSTATAQDGFIVKYNNALGLQYMTPLGATYTDMLSNIVLDASGNLYFDGYSSGLTTTIGTGGNALSFATNGNNYDVFLGKLNSSGAPIWAQMAGGTGGDYSKLLAVSADGKLLVEVSQVAPPFYTFDGVRVVSGGLFHISRYEE